MNAEKAFYYFKYPLFVIDTNGNLSSMNLAAENMLGASFERLESLPLTSVLPLRSLNGDQLSAIEFSRFVGMDRPTAVKLPARGDIDERHFLAAVSPVFDEYHELCGYSLSLSPDVARARDEVDQGKLDPLTDLPARKEFERRLDNLVNDAAVSSRTHCLLYFDIDQFKLINDTRGHSAGDNLIKQIADTLDAELSHGDTLCRLGGDEFGVLLSNVDQFEAKTLANRLIKAVKRMEFVWSGVSHGVSISAGVVLIDERSLSREKVMSQADVAVYSAKEEGRGRLHVYDASDNKLSRMQEDMDAVHRINSALEHGSFMLVKENIIPLGDGISGNGQYMELLLRMRHEGKIYGPGQFMPAAERFGLMPQIDRWVFEETIRHLKANPHLDREDVMFSINLSGQSLCQESFLDFVYRKLQAGGFNPALICFEITETVAIRNFKLVKHFIDRVHELGGRFALDDFGTGMSSFGYLQEMPVDFVKIDGMFVRDMDFDPVHEAMVRSINDISHVLGKKTIAEFVERENIAQQLRDIGVDFFQGHIYGKPEPLVDAPAPQVNEVEAP